MKKYIRTTILKTLAKCMKASPCNLPDYKGDRLTILNIFALCNYITTPKYSIYVEMEDIKETIDFIIDNYSALSRSDEIFSVLTNLCAIYKAGTKADTSVLNSDNVKKYYFTMGDDEKIRSIKALRELTRLGFDFIKDGGLKWAKDVVGGGVILGPVSSKFINRAKDEGLFQYVSAVSSCKDDISGVDYDDFMYKNGYRY